MTSPAARYNSRFCRLVEPPKNGRVYAGDWDQTCALSLAREVIAALGLDVLGEKDGHGGDHVFMLKRCAFNPDHANNDAAIMVSSQGKLKYHCFHNSCAGNGWAELRELAGISKNKQELAAVSNSKQKLADLSNPKQIKATVSKSKHPEATESNGDAESTCPARTAPITHEVFQYIKQGAGTFTVFDLDRELCYLTRGDKTARAVALNTYKKQGLIIPVSGKRGHWRVIDADCKAMNLGSGKAKPLANYLPLGLHELCDIRPGNIMVVAGSPNAGKSAYVSNYVHSVFTTNTTGQPVSNYSQSVAALMAEQICPGQKLECHFFSSEAGEDEMSSRLGLFPGGLDSFKDISFWERDRDFADVIRPNAINVVDFLEVYDDFYQIGAWINDIHRALDKGIAIVVLQKKRGRDVGKGGDVTMEKPRLYVSLENNAPYGGVCKVVKAKFPKVVGKNPNGLEMDYSLVDGWKFMPRSDWRYVDGEKARERINREYAAASSERGYMFRFITAEGEIKGLAKKDVDQWSVAYKKIYVTEELERIEADSQRNPFLTSKNWFFEISGILSKKNVAAGAKKQGVAQ